ncbi:3-phosphoserine/phosphohydroxythreonine transaminase [Shouchella shacheensis]|uniref:3-phosphoserine/phosphohydroxythreonine transaminase n=1 Tax=Shouchella shacheensis TaxID=1649580 RepID=UPI0007403F5E|nr:3-phosphoserine/phosphohydroxythreonine transaminase [Shouchella shacheensis]
MKTVYNFNAGPAALPTYALERAQEEMLNYKESGMSVMELSHRSSTYEAVHNHAKAQLRTLMAVPDDYEILFLQGGASLQFAMLPLNFLSEEKTASYILTGSWSEKALKEAKLIGSTHVAASGKEKNYTRIPSTSELTFAANEAYVHLTSNNTIFGTQWKEFPDTSSPLIADMSSDILSRKVNVRQFAMIYAGAQKNLGPSGLTVSIIRHDLLEQTRSNVPSILSYNTHSESNSLYNTPPTFAIYMLGHVLDWMASVGGMDEIERRNEEKAALIYKAMDESSGFYHGHARPDSRSRMNITFTLPTKELTEMFLHEASEAGFVGLNGHRSVGGCRASAYNAVPYEACAALQAFMTDFRKRNSN